MSVKLHSTAAASAISSFYVGYSCLSTWSALDPNAFYAPDATALPIMGENAMQKTLITVESPSALEQWTRHSTRIGSANGWTGLQPSAASLQGDRTTFTFSLGATPACTPKFNVCLKAEEQP